MKFVDLPKYGPLHRFADFHVYRTLHTLSDGKRRGRRQLADSVGLGEGSMRTIVEYLRGKGLIDIKQTGIKISPKGSDFMMVLPLAMARLEPSDSTISERNVAVQVKGKSKHIVLGIEQRDSAMKAGAAGATTVIFVNGSLLVPPDFLLDREKPDIASALRKAFDLNEGDALIIGTADTYEDAEDGALAAAFELI